MFTLNTSRGVLGPGGRLQVVVAAAVGVHVDGLKPKGKRGPYGFSTPRTPPMSTQDREEQVRVQRSALEVARATLAQLALHLGPRTVAARWMRSSRGAASATRCSMPRTRH